MPRNLYLASRSPRRLELLRQVGLHPTILSLRGSLGRLDVDELPLPAESGMEYVSRLARRKVEAGVSAQQRRGLPPWAIVAADTTVTLDGRILGKPADAESAATMLRLYSGRTHTVWTAVAVAFQGQVRMALNDSQVRFRPLSEDEIAAYIASGEPFDKAGGYGIQGRAALFIEHLSGSYSGVMGLPLCETARILQEVGFEMW
ncbi:MAG TPA: Maf family protein [Thiobacillaceae bacterium]|nr:Maf family protein [Thiobacillaceae bacterium]HNU65343.1 Maf family protein [Thiobacillaceae bacterium]